jgi:hypothetical protein
VVSIIPRNGLRKTASGLISILTEYNPNNILKKDNGVMKIEKIKIPVNGAETPNMEVEGKSYNILISSPIYYKKLFPDAPEYIRVFVHKDPFSTKGGKVITHYETGLRLTALRIAKSLAKDVFNISRPTEEQAVLAWLEHRVNLEGSEQFVKQIFKAPQIN